MANDEDFVGDGKGITDRIANLKNATEQGGDLMGTASATVNRGEDGRLDNEPRRIVEGPPSENGTETGEGQGQGEEQSGDAGEGAELAEGIEEAITREGTDDEQFSGETDEALEGLTERWGQDEHRDRDPDGTYRDEGGRLRDAATHKFLSEQKEDGEAAGEGGEADASSEGAGDADGDEAVTDDELTVELPGRRSGETYKLQARNTEEAERLRQTANDSMRRQEYDREVEEFRAERSAFESVVASVKEDPDSFILQQVPGDRRPNLARSLLLGLGDDQFGELVNDIAEWSNDPSKYRLARAEAKEKALERRETAADTRRRTQDTSSRVNKIVAQVESMAPADWTPDRTREFADYALYKLQSYYTGTENPRTDPGAVPNILKDIGALRPFGLDGSPRESDETSPTASGESSRPKSPGGEPQVKTAEKVGEEIRNRTEARKNATASSPAGAGASPSQPMFEPGQGVKERIASVRKRLGIRR